MNRVYLKLKKYLAVILMVAITGGNLQIDNFMMYADAQEEMVDLYFVDDTKEQWIKNDNAVIDLIDNTHNHVHYEMIKQDDVTWKVTVPKSAYNITFNRYNSGKTTQWNSWSAGGRDSYNTYYADGSEYGHWDYTTDNEENYFHAGDVIYLDFTEFTEWSNYDALMFVNFNGATKVENSGKDINIGNVDNSAYNPQIVDCKVADYVYAYTVTAEDEGAGELRFWRGNAATLWNCSVLLSYEQYRAGKNCVKVTGWNEQGSIVIGDDIYDINLNDDYLMVEQAYNNLQINYENNDSEYSVTQNIGLVSSIGEASVSWKSSDVLYISEDGIVNRPTDYSINITLTATISYGMYTKIKEFDVKVIKSKYKDLNTQYINVLDNIEELYLYNMGDIENLSVYLNDYGYINDIEGNYSDMIVESPEEALLSINYIKKLMGCNSPEEELKFISMNKDNYGSAYRFMQVYNGIEVYGSSIVVATDNNGNITSFHSSFVGDMSLDMTPAITQARVDEIVNSSDMHATEKKKMNIYSLDTEPILVWNVETYDNQGKKYNIIINAIDGNEIMRNMLSIEENGFGTTTGSGEDDLGVNRTFPVQYFKFFSLVNFALTDSKRNIVLYDMELEENESLLPGTLVSNNTNTWNSAEISAYANTIACYDFYYDNFMRKGFDNNNSRMNIVINDGNNIGNSYSSGDLLNFGSGGSYEFSGGAALDTVGHEYMHSVVGASTELESAYFDAPGAINEGYADIFGYFIEGDDDSEWLHREDNTEGARAIRNMSNPAEFNQPSEIGGEFYYDFTDGDEDNGGVHRNNTIVSHSCYLMWQNGISNKTRLANLWYRSLLLGYDADSTFSNVRINVLKAARDMRMTADEINIIKAAFDEVGITAVNSVEILGTNTLSGKVVVADEDAVLNNNTALDGAIVTLVRKGSILDGLNIATSFKFAITESDGTFYFTNLVPGTYVIRIMKSGYYTTTQTITLKSTQVDNYCSTVELIPITYKGEGKASGTICDSVSGTGVSDLKLVIREGMGNSTGDSVAVAYSSENGIYETPDLNTGHYCIEIIDERELVEGEPRYINTYFNVKILGGNNLSEQNATVSTGLNSEQLRIVLQWGSQPSDLDSHLLGPCSSGGQFHIYYRNKQYYENETKIADLDVDDTSCYGPETTTIYNPIDGTYKFYVYNYSGSPAMQTSGAYVQVYSGNSNEPSYTFNVPLQDGLYWTVFSYNSKTRKITPINVVGNSVAE